MSEYSKEYYKSINSNQEYDFSIKEEFFKLKQGECMPLICEGFGIKAIANENGNCLVLMMDNQEKKLIDLYQE